MAIANPEVEFHLPEFLGHVVPLSEQILSGPAGFFTEKVQNTGWVQNMVAQGQPS